MSDKRALREANKALKEDESGYLLIPVRLVRDMIRAARDYFGGMK